MIKWGIPLVFLIPGGYAAAVRDGFNARHNIFGIRIHEGIDHFDAILAQERYEWWFLRKWGMVFAMPFIALAIYFSGSIAALFMGLLAVMAHLAGPKLIPSLHRDMEIVGHTIEWLVAGGSEEYLMSEATIMSTHYKQFRGWSPEKIATAMIKARPRAQKWIDNNVKSTNA